MALVSLMELIALTKPSPVAAYLNRNAQGLKAESLGALTPPSLVPTASAAVWWCYRLGWGGVRRPAPCGEPVRPVILGGGLLPRTGWLERPGQPAPPIPSLIPSPARSNPPP